MTFPQSGSFIHTPEKPQKFVVFLHGYGANGANLIDLGHLWRSQLPPTLFWSPDALEPCEGSSFGFQWFPLFDRTLERITPGLHNAAPIVAKAILEHLDILNLTPKDTVIVGFSQGAMLALELLWHIQGLGGVMAYSGRSCDQHDEHASRFKTPVLLVHGTDDTVVPFSHLAGAEKSLKLQGFEVQTHVCPGTGHFIDETGLQEGLHFLKRIFL